MSKVFRFGFYVLVFCPLRKHQWTPKTWPERRKCPKKKCSHSTCGGWSRGTVSGSRRPPIDFLPFQSGQFITTSAEVTPKGSLVRESYPKWPGFGFIINCPDSNQDTLSVPVFGCLEYVRFLGTVTMPVLTWIHFETQNLSWESLVSSPTSPEQEFALCELSSCKEFLTTLRILRPSNGRVNEPVFCRGGFVWVLKIATGLRGFRILRENKHTKN